MSTTAQQIIEAAYARSTSNDPGKLATDTELLAHLNRCWQRLWALWGRARPDEAGSLSTVMLAFAPPQAALPADIVDVVQVTNASLQPVRLIPSNELTKLWHLAPCVYRLGMTLYSRNRAGDPIAGDTLTLNILDAPAATTSLATVLDARFPIRHMQLPIDFLAVYLQIKDAERSESDRAALLGDLKISAAAFAAEYNLPPGAVEWLHEKVKRQGGPPGA